MADLEVTGIVANENGTNLFNDMMAGLIDAAGRLTGGLCVYGSNPLTHHAIALYNSDGANPNDRGVGGLGTLVGWFSLTSLEFNNADPINGVMSPGISEIKRVDENTTDFTYAGEFGTVQAIGQFDRMVLFGATRHNRGQRTDYGKSTSYIDNSFRKMGRLRVDDMLTSTIGGSDSYAHIGVAASMTDCTNGWFLQPVSLRDVDNNKPVVRVYQGTAGDIMFAPVAENTLKHAKVTVDLDSKPQSIWKTFKLRLAPNGDIYHFDAHAKCRFISVSIRSAANNWATEVRDYLILPDDFHQFECLQYRIDDDGFLTVFFNTEDAPSVLKVYKYALSDLSTPVEKVLELDLQYTLSNSYTIHDAVIDNENQVAHIFIQKYYSDSGSYYGDKYTNEGRTSTHVTSVMYDLSGGNTAPVLNGIATVGTRASDNTPTPAWAFGGWGTSSYSNVLDGGIERYNRGDYGQSCYIFDHTKQVMRAFNYHYGDVVEWAFCPVPHFTPALAIIDLPVTTKTDQQQMRTILKMTVTKA